jgi:hypothetical protein
LRTIRFYALYDKISREDILAHAYAQCRSNKGAPGVDGQDFADIEKYGVQRWLGELALALRQETYRPDPIRRVYIPKANGKLRPLGISTLRDRVCMTAAMLVLEPIFEADLPPEQYAYRPGRNAPVADWLRDAFLSAVYPARTRPAAARRTAPLSAGTAGAVPRVKPLAPLLPLLTGSLSDETVASACRECGRALPAGRHRVFCSLRCAASNRAAIMLLPDQARLRAAIFDRGLTLADVADACGVSKAAVGQWFNKGPNGRPIPDRHMVTIRGLVTEPNATTRRFKNSSG